MLVRVQGGIPHSGNLLQYLQRVATTSCYTGESDDSKSEEELQSIIQAHNLWSPYHWSTPLDNNPVRKFYMILEQEELKKWEESGRNDVQLSTWKSTTSKVYQHLHLFEHPLQALNYVLSLVSSSMSTTVVPLNEQLHLVALNLYPEVVLQRNLLHYYKRDGSTYLELENHSDALRDVNKFTTPTVIISGCTCNYIVQMLTPHFYENHLVHTTVVSGPDYVDMTSVNNMYTRTTTRPWLSCRRRSLTTSTWYRTTQQTTLPQQQHHLQRRKVCVLQPSHRTTTWRSLSSM